MNHGWVNCRGAPAVYHLMIEAPDTNKALLSRDHTRAIANVRTSFGIENEKVPITTVSRSTVGGRSSILVIIRSCPQNLRLGCAELNTLDKSNCIFQRPTGSKEFNCLLARIFNCILQNPKGFYSTKPIGSKTSTWPLKGPTGIKIQVGPAKLLTGSKIPDGSLKCQTGSNNPN